MRTPDEGIARQTDLRFRLERGEDVLDAWSETASQAARNAVYRVLFAVQDGTVFRRYKTIENYAQHQEFAVVLHDKLIIKLRMDDEVFTISYIGASCPPDTAK